MITELRPHDTSTDHDGPSTHTHPQFCANRGIDTDCGLHLGQPVTIPATAGRWRSLADGAVLFGSARIAPALTEDRTPAVQLDATNPAGTEVALTFRVAEARRLRDQIDVAIREAEAGA